MFGGKSAKDCSKYMEEQIIIVDENDQPIGSKPRSQVLESDIYRVSALNIYNPKGQVLLGKRADSKKNNPGLWAPIVNGTNAVDETYESNIIKEANEELGLQVDSVEFVSKIRVSEKYNFFVTFFRTNIASEVHFTFDPVEISETRWINKEDLYKELHESTELFVPKFLENIFPYL